MKGKLYAIAIILMILFLTSANIANVRSSPALTLTIQTDKAKYNLGESLEFNGTLRTYGTPISDALVAVQIVDPAGDSLIYRTLNTGTEPQLNWMVEILEVVPTDESGNPKTSFRRGQLASFKITVKNNAAEPKDATLVLSCFYVVANEMPFEAMVYFQGSIPLGASPSFIVHVPIPVDAPICTAKVYANAYTQLPENVGHAWCPEESATFSITGSTMSSQALGYETLQTPAGTYGATITLPDKYVLTGNYTIYASTSYLQLQAFAYTTFEVILLGDINGDKTVDIFDAVLLSKASGSNPESPNWDPRCDLNNDYIVDIFDAVLLAANAGKTAL